MKQPPENGSIILQTDGISVAFGGVAALSDVSIHVKAGEILSVIGPNGAGKTTLFNAITGAYAPTAGRVLLEGTDITGLAPHRIAGKGITRSFQNLKPFAEMTVLENVLMGREIHLESGLFSAIFRTEKWRIDEKRNLRRARDLVNFVGLEHKSSVAARNLTYGERKMLEIARALATEPRLLLLDEPVAGMNATETGFVMELARRTRERGLTVVIIEHDMKMVMGVSDRIYVLDHGELIAEGTPTQVRHNPRVIEAYLGGMKYAPA
jgi:branched-chain amino acid transport system ATP-binding protein